VALAVGDLVSNFGFALVFPFFSLYLTLSLGASLFQAGLLLGVYGICRVISTGTAGWLVDRFGRRPVMLVSIVATSILLAGMALTRDITTTALLLLALGLFDPAFTPAARAAVSDVVPDARRPRAFGVLAVAQNVGWIAGPAIGAGLASFGYSLLFSVAAVAVASYAFVLLKFVRETRPVDDLLKHDPPPGKAGEWPPPSAPPVSAAVAASVRRSAAVFAVFVLLIFLVHIAEAQWFTTLPVYGVDHLGLSTELWGLLFALNGLLIVLLQLPLTRVMERRPKLPLIAFAVLATGAAYGLVVLIPGPGLALPFLAGLMVLITIGEMIFLPLLPSFAADLAPERARGRYQGALEGAVAAGAVLGPPLGGFCLEAAPGVLLWAISAVVCVAGGIGLWLLGAWLERHPITSAA